jgi:DNA polymerase-3 subunit beta
VTTDAPAIEDDEILGHGLTAKLRFQCKKFSMQALLEKASATMPTKDIIPVLKNFRVDVDETRIRVIATDLELATVCSSSMVVCDRPGTAVFPGKKMLDIIKEADDGDLVVDVVDGVATIHAGKATWSLRLASGDDYPALPEVTDVELHKVDRVKFLGAVGAVRHAAAEDDTRPNLMMIDVTDGFMSACDGVRYQRADLLGKEARDRGDKFPLSLQIPIAAVNDLVKLLRTTEDPAVGIGETDNHLVFGVGTDVFISSKLMAQFPDMETLLLKPAMLNEDELTVDRQELIDAIRRVRITADPETSAIIMDMADGQLTVRSVDKHHNTADEMIAAGWSKADRRIVVNHKFLYEMLQMADAKSCRFRLGADTKSRKSPLLLEDSENDSVGLINQMRADFVINEKKS